MGWLALGYVAFVGFNIILGFLALCQPNRVWKSRTGYILLLDNLVG